jgi:predicted metal-binding membrane protein
VAAPSTSLERFLLRDRTIVIVSMAGLTMASWFYLLVLSSNMAEGDRSLMGMMPMGDLMAAKLQPWTPATFALMLAMWWIMMIGMMLPSAAPMVLLFTRIERKNVSDRSPGVRSGFFALGYFLIWLGFCLIATLLQWTLGETELLSTMMASTSSLLSAAIIAAAGLYQFTPLKQACLSYCRSPIQFLTTNWRIGNNGAFRMGVSHGAYCVGCCWALMALLFVAGVMNLLWVAALAIFVLLEKVALQGPWVSRVSGFAMLGVSGAVLLQAF